MLTAQLGSRGLGGYRVGSGSWPGKHLPGGGCCEGVVRENAFPRWRKEGGAFEVEGTASGNT